MEHRYGNVANSQVHRENQNRISLGVGYFVVLVFGPRCLRNYKASREITSAAMNRLSRFVDRFALGIGLGSMLCERMSGKLVEIGLVPFGAIGMTVFTLDLFVASPSFASQTGIGIDEFLTSTTNWRILFDLFAASVFGGFFIVPLYAQIQLNSAPERRSRVIAGNNVLNALFMVVSAIASIALLEVGVTIPQLFAVLAIMNAAVACYIFTLVPEFLVPDRVATGSHGFSTEDQKHRCDTARRPCHYCSEPCELCRCW